MLLCCLCTLCNSVRREAVSNVLHAEPCRAGPSWQSMCEEQHALLHSLGAEAFDGGK